MPLVSKDRDAQIMELRLRGFELEMYTHEHTGEPFYVVRDGVSGVHSSEQAAWNAAIRCAQQDFAPYGDRSPWSPWSGATDRYEDIIRRRSNG